MYLKYFKFFFFLTIGIFLFKWVYDFFGSIESFDVIKKNKSKLFLIILAHIPTLFFDALAWRIFIQKGNLSFFWSFIITWISQASGKFFPTGTVTGEFIRIYLGIKKGLTFHESSSTVFADLVIATLSLFIISSFSILVVLSENVTFFKNEQSFFVIFSLFILLCGCIFFFYLIKKRLVKKFLTKKSFFNLRIRKKNIKFLLKLDLSLHNLSKNKVNILKATLSRLFGWIFGAFEIYIFLMIIGVEISFIDVILIEAFTGLIKSIVFFIPGALGVQELAFVLIGGYVGLGDSISFAIALGRRIREIVVGLPAVVAWLMLFEKKEKKGL